MSILSKPTWWNSLKTYYSFSDDGLPTIESNDLMQTLADHVTPRFSVLTSAAFMSSQRVVQDTSSDTKKNTILIANPINASELIGRAGVDYLSGSSGDDILYGAANKDFFMPRGGKDLIIGSLSLKATDKDTVSYETATAGIVVDHVELPPPPPPLPYNNYYSASYKGWVDKIPLTITGFVTGLGGDIVNVHDLLQGIGYKGTNPVADGYLTFIDISSGMKIQFDPDGALGKRSGSQAVVLKGVHVADFSIADNLVTSVSPPPPPPPILPDASDYTLVSQDGYGGYDVLFSVENIIGSNFNDIIRGRDDAANFLYGGAGNDLLYGEAGNDALNGGHGDDTIDGGKGNDFFFMSSGNDQLYGDAGKDTYKFGGDYLANKRLSNAVVHDFQAGFDGDKIDVSELLSAAYYRGTDPVADGYIGIRQGANGVEISFDKDGASGPGQAVILTTLNNVDVGAFSTINNLVTKNTSILLAATMGQSNSSSLRVFADDSESGLTRLEGGLRSQTDFNKVYSLMKDENGYYTDLAVGGSVVNGDKVSNAGVSWWHPTSNRPGEILIRATDILLTQVAELRAQGDVTPTIIWGQGESDAYAIGSASTAAARAAMQQTYMNATLSVFNYLLDRVGSDVQIYIMQTGNYSAAAARASGVSQTTIDKTLLGLTYVREAQEQLALTHKNIHLAVNYSDLPMFADLPSTTPGYELTWPKDQWHLSYDAKEVVGDRLADFIALDLGYDHVIDNPGPYPLNMLSDLTIHEGPGIVIRGTVNNNIITGTTGNDTISGDAGADAIVAGAGNDTLDGGAGSDTIIGGTGADTFVFLEADIYEGTDVIRDFRVTEGDVIDIYDLMDLYAAGGGTLQDFVFITEDGHGNSVLHVDQDGLGATYAAVDIALLQGITGISDVQALVDSGNLHVPEPLVAVSDPVFVRYDEIDITITDFILNAQVNSTINNNGSITNTLTNASTFVSYEMLPAVEV